MAGNIDNTKIHVGTGRLWLNVCAPGPGRRLVIDANGTPQVNSWALNTQVGAGYQIIDSNGNTQEAITSGQTGGSQPTWGTTYGSQVTDGGVTWQLQALSPSYVFVGATEGVINLSVAPKNTPVVADQATAPIDAFLSAEVESIEATLLQTDLNNLRNFITQGTYSSGTDTALPSGAQAYEMIAFGGVLTVPKISVALISPRRDVTSKYVVAQLYRAFQADAVALGFTRTKETVTKVRFDGLWDDFRVSGDRVGQLWRQT